MIFGSDSLNFTEALLIAPPPPARNSSPTVGLNVSDSFDLLSRTYDDLFPFSNSSITSTAQFPQHLYTVAVAAALNLSDSPPFLSSAPGLSVGRAATNTTTTSTATAPNAEDVARGGGGAAGGEDAWQLQVRTLWLLAFVLFSLSTMVLAFSGNLLVIVAVVTTKRLQTITNLFVV